MYLDHFGLNRPPFKITPDTRLFYPGGSRGEILDAIGYAILSGEGIVKVVGEVGSGKTMLSRMLEIRLPDHVDIVYLVNPRVGPGDIVRAITLEMGLELASDASPLEVLRRLQDELLRRHAEGRQVVCFVEEAQAMPIETLEEIRLLSNLETYQDKLLQIVLFGQPELDRNLDRPEIRQLRERIVHSFALAPFGVSEIREYVRFRMQAAGYRGPELFTPRAYKSIAKASLGLVRRINIIGDKALLAAFAANSYAVTHREVATAIADSEFGRIPPARRRMRLGWVAFGVTAVTGLALAGHAFVDRTRAPPEELALAPAPPPAPARLDTTGGGEPPAPGAGRTQSSQPTEETVAARAVPPPERPAAPAAAEPVPDDATPVAAPAPEGLEVGSGPAGGAPVVVGEPGPTAEVGSAGPDPGEDPAVVESRPEPGAQRVSAPAGASASSALDAAGGPAASGGAARPAPDEPAGRTGPGSSVIELRPVASVELAAVASSGEPRLLARRIDVTRGWLSSAAGHHFSIQLMMTRTDNWRNLERFLRRWTEEDLESVFVYETEIRGRTWYGVLFSEYDSLQAAEQALADLPAELKRHQPYVRRISRIGPVG